MKSCLCPLKVQFYRVVLYKNECVYSRTMGKLRKKSCLVTPGVTMGTGFCFIVHWVAFRCVRGTLTVSVPAGESLCIDNNTST
jgi:hypothetical protein